MYTPNLYLFLHVLIQSHKETFTEFLSSARLDTRCWYQDHESEGNSLTELKDIYSV